MGNKDERLQILKDAHKKYCEWWLPIDLACDSCMGAMSCHRFCETLLTYDGSWYGTLEEQRIKNWWDRWLGDTIPVDKKQSFKSYILKMIVGHYTNIIDLNEKDGD
jgi:hypothetical protein